MIDATSRSRETADRVKNHYMDRKRISVGTNNLEAIVEADEIYLAVKPGEAKQVCEELSAKLTVHQNVISTMAGVPIRSLQKWLNHEYVMRIMPTVNIDGPIVVYNPRELDACLYGKNFYHIRVKTEKELDASTAVSGCMPGFLAYILEAWIDEAVKLGMKHDDVVSILRRNLVTFPARWGYTSKSLAEIRARVTSKDGATERGIEALKAHRLNEMLGAMLRDADNRVNVLAHKFRHDE